MARSLYNLSDTQTKEILAIFEFLDTDRDGLISPRSAAVLCEKLGFHPEPPGPSDPGTKPMRSDDLLAWIDSFMGQVMRDDELRLTQRYALLKSMDVFATSKSRLTKQSASPASIASEPPAQCVAFPPPHRHSSRGHALR